jgi:methyl-accepting chemotaxis protein
MGTVDQVTQRNASAAEELSSTAEEMSSQAESLQRLMAFFAVSEQVSAQHRIAPSHHVPAQLRPSNGAPSRQGEGHPESGFRSF